MRLKLIGVALSCLLMAGCATTQLNANVEAVEVPVPVEQLTIDTRLLVVQPLTPIPPTSDPDNDDLLEAFTIVHDDAMRDRGQLHELSGAVKQLEYSQGQINDAAIEAAEIKRLAIDAANNETVKVKKPFWKRLF